MFVPRFTPYSTIKEMQANLKEKELLITQIKDDCEKEAKGLKDSVSCQFMESC